MWAISWFEATTADMYLDYNYDIEVYISSWY